MYYAACWHCEKSVVNYDVCFKIKTKIARKSDIDGLDLQTNIPIIYETINGSLSEVLYVRVLENYILIYFFMLNTIT